MKNNAVENQIIKLLITFSYFFKKYDWLDDDEVQDWLRATDPDLPALFMECDGTYRAKGHGWRWQRLGGAPSHYKQARVELIQAFYRANPAEGFKRDFTIHDRDPRYRFIASN